MIRYRRGATLLFGLVFFLAALQTRPSLHDRLWHHRNLGKAYYENPITQLKAIDEFKQALELSPDSARDRINYGLALLRAGRTDEAIEELVRAQKRDPSIPHAWFNLGIAYKKEFKTEEAIQQLEGMLRIVPTEPTTHYNLGVLYRQAGKTEQALSHFLAAAASDPNFAAPHFQLYNAYKEAGRTVDSTSEFALFNEIKKRKAGAAVPEDPEWSYYSEIYDTPELDGEFDQGSWSAAFKLGIKKVSAGVDAKSAGLAVLDFDGDGRPDLLVWSESGIQLLKNGTTPVTDTGLEGLKGVISVAPGDFNNDGLPDLVVITRAGATLYVNRKSKFEAYPVQWPGNYTKALWVDYDHDYDLDLILLGSKPLLLRNDGTAGFSDQTSSFPFVTGRAIDAATLELIPDNSETDLAVLYDDSSLVVYHDRFMGHYQAEFRLSPIQGAAAIQIADINNDGWPDVVLTGKSGVRTLLNDHGRLKDAGLVSPESGPAALVDLANRGQTDVIVGGSIYRNLGTAKFERLETVAFPAAVALAAADFDGDGRVDLAAVAPDGSVELLTNALTTTNSFVEIHLEGVKNLKIPVGSVVEVKAGAWYQKKTYAGVPLVFGLRAYAEVDTVRITWPNGLVQNEVKQPSGRIFAFKEQSRLSGSCPTVFAWNGAKFEFVTDVLGVAPLGSASGDGSYFPVNHREYIQIPRAALQPEAGAYEIRITEELREVSYLDKVQLLALDHKADVELFTNQKFQSPPFPDLQLFKISQRTYPARATDEAGHNVLPTVLSHDDRYIDTFRCSAGGIAKMHSLVLDFGPAAPSNRAILILNGWVDWPDASTFLAASQDTQSRLIFPYLQVKNPAGAWQTVIADMGIPSGKPKSIVVDLAGKFLSRSREVRIVTNLCVYWHDIFLSENLAEQPVRITPLHTQTAYLQYRGFSGLDMAPDGQRPERFDYDRWSPVTMWNPTSGLYTRYGDVLPLLRRVDDRMVIMGSGDELRMRFDARPLGPLIDGWQRDFLLLVDGWAKDGDSNTAYSRSVDPLPFHGMTSYPYPSKQHFPADSFHREYRKMFNTRRALHDLTELRAPRGETH